MRLHPHQHHYPWFAALDTGALRKSVAQSRAYLAYAKRMGFHSWTIELYRGDYRQQRRLLRVRERAEKKGTGK